MLGVQSVTVPAGTFTATEILHSAEKDGQPYTTFHDFFADGVGWIKRTNADGSTILFELDSYGPSSVATEAASWGRVKTIFQN